ncbi:thymocyte selection-associated high mobility group box protein TOX-like isoform X2 [Ostrea edulis]|uniref:thymocyte selection-associated high mobility group box protein TOX-like isoform X2 n=1 Tax=Ostrea edulis TaxID=37623 RepID=UPI0024AF208A|nr:thymocyte selection-associated high mobility group box protein TOX-like isoform X2 [Ostrea edulis]
MLDFESPAISSGIPNLLSSVMGDVCGPENNFLNSETFHTPSFDDDFDITSLNLPPVSNLQTPIQTSYPQQSYSNFVSTHYNVYPQQQPNPVSSVNPVNTATLTPTFPPLNFDIPDISLTNNFDGSVSSLTSMAMMTSSINNQNSLYPPSSMSVTVPTMTNNAEISIIKMEDNFMEPKQETSPSHSTNSVSPPRESSEDSSDDCLPLAQLMKRQAAAKSTIEEKEPSPPPPPAAGVTKTRKTPKKKKKKDPNEPQKPVSAYALFFRDTQAAIKGQNPSASFGEVSKIVASMWDSLDPETKNVYKKKTEMAKKEYLKQLAAYRASLVSQLPMDDNSPFGNVMDKTQLTRGPLTQTSPMHVSPNVSPPQGMWPMTSMPMQSQSPAGLHGMAPQGQSPDRHGISSQGPGISPLHQRPNMSPSMGDMMMRPPSNSPPQMGYSPQHTHISPQHIVPSPPRPVQHIAPRQPVLGQLMEEANMCLDGGDMMQSMCIRNGCTNSTIDSPGWDNEYCSNECVVNHCRDVFTAWVSSRQGPNQFTVK